MVEHPSEEWIEAANCLATVAHQLSSVVHEANNMLQVIAGSAEMIQLSANVPDAVLKRSTIIAEHAHRVSSLLGSVRELSRFAPSRDGETTDLVALVNTAIDMRRHALNRAHISLAIEGGDAPVVARSSWRPVMQILLNLLLNAEEAVRGQHKPSIKLGLLKADGEVTLSVVDNGPGFPATPDEPYTLKPVFDNGPRLGLGLKACGLLAQAEGGRLDVQAGEGGGTTATLTLKG